MAQTAEKVIEFPAGGIADFYMEDDDIAKMEKEEARKAFGDNGIANFSDVANRMASYGRGGDDTLAHVATGEIVIPLPLIDNNPEMKASIFKHLEELGVEDPEQYVVGSSANSINPETGLREFGWLKKTFRKVTRSVKKATKSVVKLAKKAAPFVLPFILGPAGVGLNMMYAGALGAGIGTLIQGGSVKDAFKSALIGGAIGGVTQGVQSGMAAGKGNFMKGFTSGVKNVATNPMQSSFTQAMSSSLQPAAVESAVADTTTLASDQFAADTATGKPNDIREAFAQQGAGPRPAAFTPDAGAEFVQSPDAFETYSKDYSNLATTPQKFMTPSSTSAVGGDGLLDSFKDYSTKAGDYLFRGGQTSEAIAGNAELARQKAITGYLDNLPARMDPNSAAAQSAALKAGEAAVATAQPGMLATYGPSLALAGGATYLAGGFTPQELDEMTEAERLEALGPSGYDLYMANKAKYGLKAETPQYAQGPIAIPTIFPQGPSLPPLAVAEGGEIFPRRVGGIMPNEGTPGKDSVRAMLMPGEFVMTTDAVRGLGNGNNNQGIRNMYDMMRGLEAKGRATA